MWSKGKAAISTARLSASSSSLPSELGSFLKLPLPGVEAEAEELSHPLTQPISTRAGKSPKESHFPSPSGFTAALSLGRPSIHLQTL